MTPRRATVQEKLDAWGRHQLQRDRLVIEAYSAGLPIAEIGRRMVLARSTVYHILGRAADRALAGYAVARPDREPGPEPY